MFYKQSLKFSLTSNKLQKRRFQSLKFEIEFFSLIFFEVLTLLIEKLFFGQILKS